jgi:hypothetical protein
MTSVWDVVSAGEDVSGELDLPFAESEAAGDGGVAHHVVRDESDVKSSNAAAKTASGR